MTLFYDKNISKSSLKHELNFEQSHHLNNVLRKRKGYKLTITNGQGLEWLGEIISFKNKKAELKKIKSKVHEKSVYKIHLVIAPAKNIKRIEWMLEKLTEMGISSITPILCNNSERKDGNHPTQKPLEILSFFINTLSNKNGLVIDPFMGSGSTGVAALNNNRKFIGGEIKKKYFNVSKKRLKKIRSQLNLFV